MERLIYPTRVMNITQNHREGNHAYHVDLPFDEAGKDGGKCPFYAPCALRVAKVYTAGVNTVWLESVDRVKMPAGTDFVTIMVEHSEDIASLKAGQKFAQGDVLFHEGKDGATGNHFHIAVARGRMKDSGWKQQGGVWVLTATGKPLRADEAFYLQNVRIRRAAGYNFEEVTMDNTPDKYAEKAVAWAREKGILKGDTEGNLKLHENITRQDVAVMLYRAIAQKGV